MTLLYDFTDKADQSPWNISSPALPFTYIQNTWSINTGGLRPTDFYAASVRHNELLVGDVISVTFSIVSGITGTGDRLAGALLTSAGLGYVYDINGPSVTIRKRTTATGMGDVIGATESYASLTNGEFFTLEYNRTTGALTAYRTIEAVLTPVFTRTDTAHEADGLYAGLVGSSENNNGRRIGVLEAEPFASTGPSVNPTGTDVVLTVGTAAAIVMQDMGGATATALTLRYTNGGLVVNTTQAGFSYTAADVDTGTIDFTATRGNLPYGSSGYQYLITLSAGDPVTYAVTSLSPAAGFEYVVASSPVSDNTGIIYQVVSGAPSNGDQAHWQTSQGSFTFDIRADFTFAATSETFPSTAAIPVDYWNSETGTWYALTVNVAFNEDGGGTVTGITARNITLRGITMRKITARPV